MTMTAQETTIVIALISAAISFVALLRNTSKDSKEEITGQTKQLTEISTNVNSISREIKELKNDIKDFRHDLNEIREKATKAAEAARLAHERLNRFDEISKKEIGG